MCLAYAHEQISVCHMVRAPHWASVIGTEPHHIYQSLVLLPWPGGPLSTYCLLELPSCRPLRYKNCAVSFWSHCHQSQSTNTVSFWWVTSSQWDCIMDKGWEVFISQFLFLDNWAKTSLVLYFYKYLLVGITILKGHKHLLQQLVSVLLIKGRHLEVLCS